MATPVENFTRRGCCCRCFLKPTCSDDIESLTQQGESAPPSTTTPSVDPAPQVLLLTVEQAAHTLAIGRTAVYELISHGRIGSVRIGGSRRIPAAALDTFVQQLLTDTTPPPA